MGNSNWVLTDRVITSEKEGKCIALNLARGLGYELELPFLPWLEQLSQPRTEEALISSLSISRDQAKLFLKALAEGGLIEQSPVAASSPLTSLPSTVESYALKELTFPDGPEQEWQSELVFAASAILISLSIL